MEVHTTLSLLAKEPFVQARKLRGIANSDVPCGHGSMLQGPHVAVLVAKTQGSYVAAFTDRPVSALVAEGRPT